MGSILESDSTEWHSELDFNNAVEIFHDKYARQPAELDQSRRMHTEIISQLTELLRSQNACEHLEYTGSSYEGTKVAKSMDDHDLEFDVMVILKCGNRLRAEPLAPSYAQLRMPHSEEQNPLLKNVASYTGILGLLTKEEWVISPEKVANRFFGMLQKCIDDCETTKGKIKLRKHGPAVQMNLYPNSGFLLWGKKLYSVDMVPTFRVSDQLYVAKPLEKDNNSVGSNSWRRSFSLEEKAKLSSSDKGNGCRRRVLRVLKVLRNREAGLAPLTSYHLKTALFRVMDYPCISWSNDCIGERLIDVLAELESALSSGWMQHYFDPTVNLLSGLSSSNISNMRDRIKRLINNKHQMMKLL